MKIDDDDFTLFGLPRRHDQSRAEIDRRWRALQAEVHPDRFAASGAAAQRVAMQWALRVNEAHRRLKDPLERAAYLCQLAGVPVAAESNTRMPAEFLAQQMEWREALDEAADRAAVQALADEVQARERQLMGEIGDCLDRRGDPAAAAERVRATMFVRRFARDVDQRLDAFDSPD